MLRCETASVVVVAVLAAVAVVACSAEPTAIRGSDRATFTSANLSWAIVEPPATAPDGGAGDGPDLVAGVAFFDLDVVHAHGRAVQLLGPGGQIVFEGGTIPGPARVPLAWTVTDVTLAFRGGAQIGSRLRVEGIAGLEGDELTLDVAGVRQRKREFGPCLGAQARFEVVRSLALVGRWQEYLAVFGRGVTDSLEARPEQFRVGAVLGPLAHVEIFGGWNWWIYRRVERGADSDVILRLNGPMVALRLVF